MKEIDKILKKLTFNVWIGTSRETLDVKSEPIEWSFIYGIGSGGLSDFEIAIAELELGGGYKLDIKRSSLNAYFGPLFGLLSPRLLLPAAEGVITLTFELTKIVTSEPKEIVTAIAELQNSGGCGCGSGCSCN